MKVLCRCQSDGLSMRLARATKRMISIFEKLQKCFSDFHGRPLLLHFRNGCGFEAPLPCLTLAPPNTMEFPNRNAVAVESPRISGR